MNIIFICGCLEPGRDGVGDYTLKLGEELVKKNHQVFVISLNDSYINKSVESELLETKMFSTLRISKHIDDNKRFHLAQVFVEKFNPDWISLQFVIYSYHHKGLPFGIGKRFKVLGKNVKWHIMFHEIWIGIGKPSLLKERIIGYFQKGIISAIVKEIQPQLITTSNSLYNIVLKNNNINSIVLPLFSNIDIALKNEVFITHVLSLLGISSTNELNNWKIAGIFGTLHPKVDLKKIIENELIISNSKKLKMAFISFGRVGHHGTIYFNKLEIMFPDIKFLELGEQTHENVSNIVQLLNVGISCTQLSYIGKSGVFAIMKLHGLDIVIPNEERFPEYDEELQGYLLETVNSDAKKWSVANRADNLLKLLYVR